MRDDDGTTMVSAIDVRSEKICQRSRERRKLGGAKKVEEKEDCEDKNQSEGGKRRVDEDGWEKHDDHHSMKDFAPCVNFHERGQAEYEAKANDKDADAVEAYKKAHICSAEGMQLLRPDGTLPILPFC